MTRFTLFLTASLTGSLWTIPARGATTCVPTPLAPCPSDIFQVTDGNGNVLTDANGNLASVTLNENSAVGEATGEVIFNFPGTFAGPPQLVVLTEGSQTSLGLPVVSDTVLLKAITLLSGPAIEVTFSSDGDSGVGLINCTNSSIENVACIPETGAVQDVTALAFAGGSAPFHILMQSDPAEVPEPGTLALLGVGLAGITALGARRTRV